MATDVIILQKINPDDVNMEAPVYLDASKKYIKHFSNQRDAVETAINEIGKSNSRVYLDITTNWREILTRVR